ncbi:MAG TPA: DinB family protein [Candidatus Dormibacteraeota bacterium]|nr:DinB family protein [Candidatus Dormibacteraeota bacterium]
MDGEILNTETEVLLRYLQEQRDHVLGTLEGLTEEEMHRAMLPSGWTFLGLIQHLAIDVEHFWFTAVVGGEGFDLDKAENAWQVAAEASSSSMIDLYRREAQKSDEVINSTPLAAAPVWWPDELFGSWRLHDLKEVMLHVITETACHTGHLDAARELIDGRQWLVLTG